MASNSLWSLYNPSATAEERREHERQAIERCRRGDWKDGVAELERLLTTPAERAAQALSPLGLSCLGLGWIRLRRQSREGLAFCEQAAKRDFYQPEILLNLAEAYLASGQRGRAAGAVGRGLKIDPDHAELLDLARRLGRRRRPVFGALPREHPINKVAGKIRHGVRGAT